MCSLIKTMTIPEVHPPSSCPDAHTITLMLQGAIKHTQIEAIQAHLNTCARCAEELSILMSVLPSRAPSMTRGEHSAPHRPVTSIDRYRIQGVLGTGAMGVVFDAQDTQLDRRVALKLIRPDLKAPQAATQRLLREARALAALDHPNILTLFDAGTHDTHHIYMTSALIEGETIDVWAKGRPWQDIVSCYEQVCEGLMHAHSRGFVHRDIKPQNIIVDQRGQPHICDFGLAHHHDVFTSSQTTPMAAFESRLTQSGALIGTPAYMPPEQLDGQQVGHHADQYALCASLYEAIYGFRPHMAQSLEELLRSARSGQLTFPPSAEIPVALPTILRQGLHPRAGERHEDMEALRAALYALRTRSTTRPSRFKFALLVIIMLVASIFLHSMLKEPAPSHTLPVKLAKKLPAQKVLSQSDHSPSHTLPSTPPRKELEQVIEKKTPKAKVKPPRTNPKKERPKAQDLLSICASNDCERCLTLLLEQDTTTLDADTLHLIERQAAQCAYKLGRCDEAIAFQWRAFAPSTSEQIRTQAQSMGTLFHTCPLTFKGHPDRRRFQLMGLLAHAVQTKSPKTCLATWSHHEKSLRTWPTQSKSFDTSTEGAMAHWVGSLAQCIDAHNCEEARNAYTIMQHLHHKPGTSYLDEMLARAIPNCVQQSDSAVMRLASKLELLKQAQSGNAKQCAAAWKSHHVELKNLLSGQVSGNNHSATQTILHGHLRCLAPFDCTLAAQLEPLLDGRPGQRAHADAILAEHCPL